MVMDKEEHHQKCLAILTPPTYLILEKDPTQRIERKVTEILKTVMSFERLCLLRLDHQSARLLGSLVSPRSIPPETHCVCHRFPNPCTSQVVTSLISPLVGTTSSFMKNLKHFAEMVSQEKVGDNQLMVSFDVESLFTNVPIIGALAMRG